MKLRNKILAIAVAAVAGISAYNANNTNSSKLSDLQLENIEMLAEAQEDVSQGTLMGNKAGTRFCCASGSNSCGAAPC